MKPSVPELVELLVRGEQPAAISGTFRWLDAKSRQRVWRVFRQGRLARIEDPPGVLSLVASDETYWMFWPPAGGFVAVPRAVDHDDFELSRLTKLDPGAYWRSWLSQDVSGVEATLERVEHDGRPAWRFTAPEAKGVRVQLTVDQETGLLVRAEHPTVGVFEEWLDLSVDRPGDDLFRYEGEWERAEEFASRYPPNWTPS